MKTVLVIPDGVAIRNFLCSTFCERLAAHGEVTVWHALPEPSVAPHRERLGARVRWRRLPAYREPLIERVLRRAKLYAQLYWHGRRDGSTVLLRYLRPSRWWLARLVDAAARMLGRAGGFRTGTVAIDGLHRWLSGHRRNIRPCLAVLAEERPDIVFCAHQRASRAIPAMAAARKLGLPTATFIYSWDNLPKGRMAIAADHYLVWSDHMASEMRAYYPEVAGERIHVVGTPQFEPYFDPPLATPRAAFLTGLGLDPARPVICYSGCDLTSAPYDETYLADLAEVVRAWTPAERPQILFRRSPADFSDRYDAVLAAFPEIAVSDPAWLVERVGDWTQTVATPEDVRLLANVVRHCALVVNVGSTMAMDFAVLDKPSIFITYDPADADPRRSIRHGPEMPHFRLLRGLRPLTWVEHRDDLGPAVRQALAHPEARSEARRRWLEAQVAQPLDQASARCVEALRRLAAASASGPNAASDRIG